MKKTVMLMLSVLMVFTVLGCEKKEDSQKKLVVGICQLVKHEALDAATKGFMDALVEQFGDGITFIEENGAGDGAACTLICNSFVSEGVDLIMANATPALKAAAGVTEKIPVIGTSISSYGVALGIEDMKTTTGINVSGTSDLAPLDKQAQMIIDLIPDAKTVGILFCSSEPNSVFQVEIVRKHLQEKGLTVKLFSFADSSDVALVTGQACDECDCLYIPTDNTAANCADLIGSIVLASSTPVIAGEEAVCRKCAVATLTIDYYQLGVITGKMAARVLNGQQDVSAMEIEYFDDPVYKFNPQIAEKLNISIPEGYVALQMEA